MHTTEVQFSGQTGGLCPLVRDTQSLDLGVERAKEGVEG